MNILITGAGSVMGQSIYKALATESLDDNLKIHFANSELLGAGRFFSNVNAPIVNTPIFPLASDPVYSEFLEDYVKNNAIEIVFSGTQHELGKIALFRDRTLKAATIPSFITDICSNKITTTKIMNLHGIRAPKTCTLREFISVKDFDRPVIIKPNYSSSSRSIYRAKNFEDALNLANSHALDLDNFLVQELLSGEEYTCGCYIDRYTKKINHITFKRTLTSDGATFYGEIIKNPEIDDYINKIGHALIHEGLDFGHVNVQLILTTSGPVLFEINGRLSSTEAAKAHYGFNSCAAFVSNIVKKEPYLNWQTARKGKFLRFYEELYFN
jgi:carbamoyl-phosphate synthase large subunit